MSPGLGSKGAITPLAFICTGNGEAPGKPLAAPGSTRSQALIPLILQHRWVRPCLVVLDLPGKEGDAALSPENPLPALLTLDLRQQGREGPVEGPPGHQPAQVRPSYTTFPISQGQKAELGKTPEKGISPRDEELEPSAHGTFTPSGPSSPGGPRRPIPPCSGHKQRSPIDSTLPSVPSHTHVPLPGQ